MGHVYGSVTHIWVIERQRLRSIIGRRSLIYTSHLFHIFDENFYWRKVFRIIKKRKRKKYFRIKVKKLNVIKKYFLKFQFFFILYHQRNFFFFCFYSKTQNKILFSGDKLERKFVEKNFKFFIKFEIIIIIFL